MRTKLSPITVILCHLTIICVGGGATKTHESILFCVIIMFVFIIFFIRSEKRRFYICYFKILLKRLMITKGNLLFNYSPPFGKLICAIIFVVRCSSGTADYFLGTSYQLHDR